MSGGPGDSPGRPTTERDHALPERSFMVARDPDVPSAALLMMFAGDASFEGLKALVQ
jgi:hypothetical protein